MILAEVVEQTKIVTQTGLGMGSALAIVCSWQRNRSILAGILSWFYVIYFALTRKQEETK